MEKKALFWHKQDDIIKCTLCPNYCRISNGETGRCRKRFNYKGELYAKNFGETIAFNLDPMTKKPLYHFHPKDKILSIGANSCNLSCQFCQNYTSSQFECQTKFISPVSLVNYCSNHNIKHVAFTYTEPFTWYEYIKESAVLLKEKNISVVLVTNGFVNKEPLMDLLPYISAMNIDLKAFTDDFYVNICGGKLQPVLDTITIAHSQTHVEITFLMIETLNDNLQDLHLMFSFIKNLNRYIPLHISKYFPRFKIDIKETSEEKLFNIANIAKLYLENVYVGNVWKKEV